VGTEVGGYLAYALGLTNGTTYKDKPDLFTFVGSVNGDFANDVWELGNVQTIINNRLAKYEQVKKQYDAIYGDYAEYFYPANPLGSHFTYMDTPVESAYANEDGSTNDLGSIYIQQGIGSGSHEYTARPGVFNNEFIAESGKRLMNNFTDWMLNDTATGKVSLSQATLTKEVDNATANYSVTIKDEIASFTSANTTMKVTVSVIDPESGNELSSSSTNVNVTGAGEYKGSLKIANKVNGNFSNVVLSVKLLSADIELGKTYLVRNSKPVIDGEYQVIDLMGDWRFNYTKYQKLDVSNLTDTEYNTWSIAQPGVCNWEDGHGNISEANVGYAPDDPLFGMLIIGNGYYVKEFDIPANFTAKDVVLSIGYIDDRCEVFVNGKRVGATGMKDNGESTNETTWAVYSNFEIDPALLNYGGKNVVVVRAYNDTTGGAGGWYSGPIGLYSKYAFENSESDTSSFVEETYYSKAIGQNMDYMIYLPKDYDKTEKYYPTMYLLHQFNSDHTSYRTDEIDRLMDELIADGKIDDMIVVVPNSSEMSFWQGAYEKMVIEDLIPHIDENYRTVKDARYRLTTGCSMGGQGAMSVALRNPDYFSGAVSFFGAFSYGDVFGTPGIHDPRRIANAESAEYLDNYAMYFICGNQDSYGFGSCNIDLHQQLLGKDVNHVFFIENGEHNSAFYVPNFKDGVEYVYNNMQIQDAAVKNMVYGEVGVLRENGKAILTPMFGVKDSFADYFNTIPDSTYTENQTPDVNIPLIITLKQNGNTQKIVIRDHYFERGTTVNVLDPIDVSDLINPYLPFSVTFEAALFHHDPVVLKDIPDWLMADADLPDTGDHSSMMLYGLAFLASVAVLLVIGKRRNCIS